MVSEFDNSSLMIKSVLYGSFQSFRLNYLPVQIISTLSDPFYNAEKYSLFNGFWDEIWIKEVHFLISSSRKLTIWLPLLSLKVYTTQEWNLFLFALINFPHYADRWWSEIFACKKVAHPYALLLSWKPGMSCITGLSCIPCALSLFYWLECIELLDRCGVLTIGVVTIPFQFDYTLMVLFGLSCVLTSFLVSFVTLFLIIELLFVYPYCFVWVCTILQ